MPGEEERRSPGMDIILVQEHSLRRQGEGL